jgi:hypothetical protein
VRCTADLDAVTLTKPDGGMAREAGIALRTFIVAVLLCLSVARVSSAQGEISGRVLSPDSGRPPIPGAEASISKLGRRALSDSSGRFRLKDIPPGGHVVFLRAIGFRSESSVVAIDQDEVVSWDVVLTRSTGTVLPERVVSARTATPTPARLVEFMERREAGVGRFISREQLAKAEGGLRKTGDLISTLPGVTVRRGSNKIWIASSRTTKSAQCAFCAASVAGLTQADFAAGARPACFTDVYLDGAMVFDSRHPENGLFDVNAVPPEHIAGIEVYASAAQVPAKYNRTGGGCGVLLIWTR